MKHHSNFPDEYRWGYRRKNGAFGGDLLGRAHPKTKRPINFRKPLHLTIRAEAAKGSLSMLHKSHRMVVNRIVRRCAAKFGVQILRYSNVGNHLHILIRVDLRQSYNAFIRSITGLIARRLRTKSGQIRSANFWDARPFTRIVQYGRDFTIVLRYLHKNDLQAQGFCESAARIMAAKAWAHILGP